MPHGTHPPEELLEVLVLAADEMSPPLRDAVTQHVQECDLCRHVLSLLIRFYRAVEREGRPPHAAALLRVVHADDPAEPPSRAASA